MEAKFKIRGISKPHILGAVFTTKDGRKTEIRRKSTKFDHYKDIGITEMVWTDVYFWNGRFATFPTADEWYNFCVEARFDHFVLPRIELTEWSSGEIPRGGS